jgi:hypothetical protein
MHLYQAERHERLIGDEWNEDRARDAIDRIVTDTVRSFDPDALGQFIPSIVRLNGRLIRSSTYTMARLE